MSPQQICQVKQDKASQNRMSANLLSVTLERSQVIDFTRTVFTDTVTLNHLSLKEKYVNWKAFVNVFHLEFWIMLIAILFCIIMVFKCMVGDVRYSYLDAFWLVYSLVLQRDSHFTKKSLFARCTLLNASLLSFVIFSCYSAMLTSTMVLEPETIPLKTFEELLERGHQIVVLEGSSRHQLFLSAPQGSIFETVYKKLIMNNPKAIAKSYADFLALIKENSNAMAFAPQIFWRSTHEIQPVRGFTQKSNIKYSFGLVTLIFL